MKRCCLFRLSENFVLPPPPSGHFYMVRYYQRIAKVQDDEPYYRSLVVVPSILFGSKYAILLQMALLPLTMCRYSITSLSDSIINRFIPLNKVYQMHAYLGYIMVSLVLFALVTFIGLYGSLCILDGPTYCQALSSEIMCTGYAIAALVLLVGISSYLRHRIRYEIFYILHRVVLLVYIITILHTFDSIYRNDGTKRSQTYSWVSGSLLYYLCDRLASFLTSYYQIKMASAVSISGTQGSRMVLLKIRRPTLFDFEPGQYAFPSSTFH